MQGKIVKFPNITDDEKNRLESLRALKILDTASEERFDRLTRLAQYMFNVPIAVVSLVDEDRQWFKSACGLDVSETSREISFCGHAILGDEPLIVHDATKDERFFDNPLVTGSLGIRFYAGIPLKDVCGYKLGTLCLIDTDVREFTDEDISALKDLAEQAQHELIATQLASLDDLTKLLNRRGFLTRANNQLKMCIEKHMHSSYISIDLNNFKAINDEFGHAEGDRALQHFTKLMHNTFRGNDLIARLGGDEFAVLLSSDNPVNNSELLTRFQHIIAEDNENSEREYDLTFSYGAVSIQPLDRVSLEQIMLEADEFMYRDKKSSVDRYQDVYSKYTNTVSLREHTYL